MMGVVVDYLCRAQIEMAYTNTKHCSSTSPSLHIISLGAKQSDQMSEFEDLAEKVTGLDDNSINAMCKMTVWDTKYRTGADVEPDSIFVDETTCEHIRLLVMRTLNILLSRENYPIKFEPTFNGGYSEIIRKGDADYLSQTTLYDLKVSKKDGIDSKQTLQLALYFLLGKRAVSRVGLVMSLKNNPCEQYFASMENIAIINPRHNCLYIMNMHDLPEGTVESITDTVIYGKRNGIIGYVDPFTDDIPQKKKLKTLFDFEKTN